MSRNTEQTKEIEQIIRTLALKNALDFRGKANPGAIIGKILGQHAEWREKREELSAKVNKIVKEVNKLSAEKQKAELEKSAPELLEKKEKQERDMFAFLGIKKGDKVITAFPPGPEKYPHIGHAKALLLNYMLAKQCNGKFILRFEDTNPKLVQKIFYDIMQENFRWLGVKWDELIYASDHMSLFYELCEKIIRSRDAYVCSCDGEKIKESREKGTACDCRSNSAEENLELWKNMKNLPEGHAIVRLRIDLSHSNTTMRDPTIFRILDEEHARHSKKYRIWPNYDFQNAIMDGKYGVTHRLRSKEFELRSELQRYIQKLLGFQNTTTYEFGRFNLEGVESSGRIIREKIEKGELLGWDDPSLTTLVALRRRGFRPEAIKSFVLSTGVSKAEATLTWDDLIMHNKRLLDAESDRYFFVANPVEIRVEKAPAFNVELDLHPSHRKGGRKFSTGQDFFVAKKDFENLKEGKLYRLMDCLNFRKEKKKFIFDSTDVENYKKKGEKIVHWLPRSDELVNVEVIMPDKESITGLAEKGISKLKPGELVQFSRFGFCRLDKKEKDSSGKDLLVFWFTHG
jgi:glutamyl-tRNA synthetase